MKTLSLLLTLLILASCGSDPEAPVACSASKSPNSIWTRQSDNSAFDARNCSVGTICYFYNDSACDAAYDTEFSFLYKSDNTFEVGDCSLNKRDGGSWSIGCDNVLTLTYDDGTVVKYD